MLTWLAHLDWYVLLTPLLLLPIFLLFVFVGCQYISGVNEYEVGEPETPPVTEAPELVFEYKSGLTAGIVALAWVFSETLEHAPGEATPSSFPTDPFRRGEGSPTPIDPNGEVKNHGAVLGEPTGGGVLCRVFGFLPDDPPDMPSLHDDIEKQATDSDFPVFILRPPFDLT